MSYFVENETMTNDLLIHKYQGLNVEDLDVIIEKVLIVLGYRKLGQGHENVMYEKGDRTKRILFGAFHKYIKISVTISKIQAAQKLLIIKNASTGFSGGIIGIKQVKKEFSNLATYLQSV